MIVPIVVILVVVALGIFGFSYYQKNNSTGNSYPIPGAATNNSNETVNTVPVVTQTPKMETASVKIVILSDSGFSPASTEVRVGETVKFINNGSGKMWVASAPHPAHTNYSEFDEKTGTNAGGSYEFTFLKTGSWKYHNHLNPSQFGTIVVK